jgi:hypothetical protein
MHILSDAIRPISPHPSLVSCHEYKLTTTIVELDYVSPEKTAVHQQFFVVNLCSLFVLERKQALDEKRKEIGRIVSDNMCKYYVRAGAQWLFLFGVGHQ